MEQHRVKILSAQHLTHNVMQFKVEKPDGYQFTPGQATEIAIPHPDWENEKRPFTFTGLNEWDHLEFTIKIYPQHRGVTHQLSSLKAGDALLIHDVWGAIRYKGEGVFIAGGAGITPFIAIFRQLHKDGQLGHNRLLFSNKTEKDIILQKELTAMLGKNFINTLTEEKMPGYDHGRIDKAYLQEKINRMDQHFYLCGPDPMVQSIQAALKELGATESLITVEI